QYLDLLLFPSRITSYLPDGMVSSAAMLPETSTDGGSSNGHAEPGDLRSQFRSSLLGPGRTLRRPSFGPPKARAAEPEEPPLVAGEHPLVDQVEEMFRSWPELERTVAAERLFAA